MPHIGQPGFGAKDILKNVGYRGRRLLLLLLLLLFLALAALLTVLY